MLVGKSSFRVVLPYSIFLFFIFAVLVFSSLPFGEKEVVAAEAAATKTTPVTKKFYDEKKFKEFQENLLNYDTDKDDLSDVDEIFIYKTDPEKKDSDKDGFSDGNEIKGGYNPLGSGKMTAEMIDKIEEKKKDYDKILISEDLIYCNALNEIFNIYEKKLEEKDIKYIAPIYTKEMMMEEIKVSPEEIERIKKNFNTSIDYNWFEKIGQRNSFNSKNISKYCSDLKKKSWQQIEMAIDQECSGYDYDEWLKITKKGETSFVLVYKNWRDVFNQGLEETCPDYQKNIEAVKKNKIKNLKKLNRYESIGLIYPHKNDLFYMGFIGDERYLVHAKSGKKELVPKKYQDSGIKIENNNIIINPDSQKNEWFLYENGKVGKLLYKGEKPLELEASYNQSLKIKNGSIISYKDNANYRYEKTDLIKNSKPYKTISGNVISLIAYKDTFLAYSDKRLYLDSKDVFLFDGFSIEDKIIKDDILYALAYKTTTGENNKSEETYYLLSFDGKTEKEIKKFDNGVVVSEMLILKDELAFNYYNTKNDGDKKCSKSRANKFFNCLTFLNPEKFKNLNNIEVYGKYPYKWNFVSKDKKNIIIQTSPNSFNINGQEKKYDVAEDAFVKDLVNDYGICYPVKPNRIACIINKKTYLSQGYTDFMINNKKFSWDLEYLVYDNKVFYVDNIASRKDKNIMEEALFVNNKEVARCKEIRKVYIDEKEKGSVYYTCQYDQSQGGGEALKKITIK